MVICLSNLAMLHFNFKELGQEAPPELYLHAEDLWKVVKHFIFPDGRLLRIGGDTRARYTYCQCYAIPMWLMAADVFHDRDAARFEQNWLNIVRREMDDNGDGACYTRRLDKLGKISYYYFCRLESDHILSLSYGAYWRRKFTLPQPAELPDRKPAVWEDDFHDAAMIRTGSTVRSWVKAGAQGPTGLCVPLNRSDMAEWQGNLNGVLTGNNIAADFRKGEQKTFPGGFFYTGSAGLVERLPMGEGEERYLIAEHQSASAALPDGKTLLVAERCVMKKEATLHRVLSLNLELPNDVFNGFRRHFRSEEFDAVLTMPEGKGEVIDTRSRALNIDNCLTVRLLSGGESLKIVRSGRPQHLSPEGHPAGNGFAVCRSHRRNRRDRITPMDAGRDSLRCRLRRFPPTPPSMRCRAWTEAWSPTVSDGPFRFKPGPTAFPIAAMSSTRRMEASRKSPSTTTDSSEDPQPEKKRLFFSPAVFQRSAPVFPTPPSSPAPRCTAESRRPQNPESEKPKSAESSEADTPSLRTRAPEPCACPQAPGSPGLRASG